MTIDFDGVMTDNLRGFYRSKYTTLGNETEWMALTQFEPLDARRAFPCFDEPWMKAKFTVTITAPADYTALANTPVLQQETTEDGMTVRIRVPYGSSHLILSYAILCYPILSPS